MFSQQQLGTENTGADSPLVKDQNSEPKILSTSKYLSETSIKENTVRNRKAKIILLNTLGCRVLLIEEKDSRYRLCAHRTVCTQDGVHAG